MNRVTCAMIVVAVASWAAPVSADAKAFDAGMRKLLAVYLTAHKPLTEDSVKGVAAAGTSMATLAGKLDVKAIRGKHARHLRKIPGKIKTAAQALSKARGLEASRKAFKKLSLPMVLWATLSKPAGVWIIYCSMTRGSWLQTSKGIRNPYHGTHMLYCGQIVWPERKK